ncbi:MAG: sensor histidine kinase N-terminal domain-containing protein [Burkholderiaceae bacterium]|nr:sensor histidine kinase N-terminal domain-containing protein [Burkholderiaceae bacterium]
MKLFQGRQRSLFGEILDWMLTPFLLLWPITFGLTWLVAEGIAKVPFDRSLQQNVNVLAQLVQSDDTHVRFQLPDTAHRILHADATDTVYYQVLGGRSELLGGEAKLPLPQDDEKFVTDEMRLRDDMLNGTPIRVAYMWVRVQPQEARPALVQVAETLEKRSVLAREIIRGVMLPLFVILPLSVLLVWLALTRGIKPLNELEDRIRQRKPGDMSPLDEHTVPSEVVPLVSSINDLLVRLQGSIATQKRFLADAAHQLKTPLAGLRMQADLAQRSDANAQDLKQSLKHIGLASMRATHTVNQLLALARAESSGMGMATQTCDLSVLTMEVVKDSLPRAMELRIDLGFEGPQPHQAMLPGNPTLLKEMVRNLIDNALNYTPSSETQPGVVTARVCGDAQTGWRLEVEDSGPGIAASERERVFEPFYRALGNEADGSGLGLAIVREIAVKHHAQVSISDTHEGHSPPGARFSVRFSSINLNR